MLWHALTPQVFRYGLLSDILSKGQISCITDESSAVESTGLKPLVIECNTANPKVTKTEDLALAEFILRREKMTIRIGQGFDVHAFGDNIPLVIGGVKIPFTRV